MTVAYDIFKDAKDYQTFPPGEMIFEEGDVGDVMYVVIEGEVDIMVKDVVVDQLSPGDIFGEMALIDDSPRSGGARARTECKVVPVNQYNFTHYVQHSPFFAIQVMTIMANRLRRLMDREN
jgi:CRP-like cAMP-binding protein